MAKNNDAETTHTHIYTFAIVYAVKESKEKPNNQTTYRTYRFYAWNADDGGNLNYRFECDTLEHAERTSHVMNRASDAKWQQREGERKKPQMMLIFFYYFIYSVSLTHTHTLVHLHFFRIRLETSTHSLSLSHSPSLPSIIWCMIRFFFCVLFLICAGSVK